MLYEARLPKYLQGKAVLAAIYIYNRTLYTSLGFKTPYEVRYGTKPDLNNIKIFGSIVYYRNPSPKKLETRVKKAILLGFTDYGNYKLLDLDLYKVIFAQDIKVIEGTYLDSPRSEEPAIVSKFEVNENIKNNETFNTSSGINKIATK